MKACRDSGSSLDTASVSATIDHWHLCVSSVIESDVGQGRDDSRLKSEGRDAGCRLRKKETSLRPFKYNSRGEKAQEDFFCKDEADWQFSLVGLICPGH